MVAVRSAVLWAALCLAMVYGAPMEVNEIAPRADNYRLPLDIMPINYQVIIRPYLSEYDGAKHSTFDGEAFVTIKATKATNKIVIHSKTLTFTTREYWDASNANNKITLGTPEHNTNTDISTYTLSTSLDTTRTYVLHFVYTGKMEDDMHGFYRSSYVDAQNNTIWLGSTQFESNHARRAFPCFDEPKFKATFDLTLKHNVSMNTFANTPLKSSTIDGSLATDVYVQSPVMSTYLVAFIVSTFGHRTDGKFGVIARPELYNQGEYSFNVGRKLLAAFDNYLQIPYYSTGVAKMDMAAIPDFSAGAMENWGLLTYRERNLLFDEDYTTLNAKQAIAAVIAHEQAHMWFGDLVTCDWWSYTWLNEGFARYFQYYGTHWVETDMQLDQQFVTAQLQSVMNMDSTNATNPMSDEDTNTPADISRMFNSVTYNKGAVFIRMVNHIIGETNFQKSLTEYLNLYKFKNTIPTNLFDVWKKYWPAEFATHVDSFFAGYTTQVGYPLINVTLAADGRSFEISQKRFLLKENDGADGSLLYTVPITYTTNNSPDFNDTKPKLFLPQSTNKVNVQLAQNTSWVIANIQETGYYRVTYDEKTWHSIHHALFANNWSGIPHPNRGQIVDDLLNLARAGLLSYDFALTILEYLETETHYVPWAAAFTGFNYLTIRLGTDTQAFGHYIRQITDKAYNLLGFEEKSTDTSLDIYNRASILSWACKYNNVDCVNRARTYFNGIDNTPVPVNIRSVVYCTAMRTGSADYYNKLVERFKKSTVATDQTLILSSLGCVKDTTLVQRQFNFTLSNDVRRQDKSSALSSLYTENNENVDEVFKLVTQNVDEVATALGGYSEVATVISNIASRFTEQRQLDELSAFNKANENKFGSAAATLKKAEITVQENLAWSTKHLPTFRSYLATRGNGAASLNVFTMFSVTMFAICAILMR